MRKTYILWLLGLLVTVAMVVAMACGDDEEEDGEAPTATEPSATEPADGAEVPGVTDTEILLGTHQPLSGSPAAVYAQIAKVTSAYFDFINETEGGVHGRKITLLIEDDQYTPSLTVEVVRKLVEQDGVFAMLNGLGTATHMAVVDYLQDRGVPDMYMSTGAIEWVKDPETRPTVFGTIPNYIAEGLVLGDYIAKTYPGMKLGFIGQNDEFGQDGLEGIERGVGDALEILDPEWFEAVDPDVNSQVDRLQAAGADVVVVFAVPTQAAAAPRHARADLNWDVPFVITGVSANELTLALAGEGNMEGVVSQVAIRQAYETDHPGIAAHLELLENYGEGLAPNYLTIYGQTVGEIMVETLTQAGPDLTREGLIEAAESATDFQCTVCLFPGTVSATDHDPTQSVILASVENGQWVPFGDGYTWEGVSVDDLSLDTLETVPSPYE